MIESAVHDLNQGISTFWADKSLVRFGGQLFETLTISKITDSFNATDNVQNRRSLAFINTCHDARFEPHVGVNVDAG